MVLASTTVPRVGVGVIVIRDGLVLLGQRKGAQGSGTWALPGGHLEFGESVEDCARRETREETGLQLDSVIPGPFINTIFAAENTHYVTLFVASICPSGEPELLEPDKCAGWSWFSWLRLPEPLFKPLETLSASGFSLKMLAARA